MRKMLTVYVSMVSVFVGVGIAVIVSSPTSALETLNPSPAYPGLNRECPDGVVHVVGNNNGKSIQCGEIYPM